MKRKAKIKLIKWGIGIGAVVVVLMAAYFITKPWGIYDYSHLTNKQAVGTITDFAPLATDTKPAGMPNAVLAAENETLALFVDSKTFNIAVTDKRSQETWYAAPAEVDNDAIANPMEKQLMKSPLVLQYFTDTRYKATMMTFDKAVENEQVVLKSIDNGLRVEYTVGDTSLGINAAPLYITEERLEEKFISKLEDESEIKWLKQRYVASKEKEGFLQLLTSVIQSKIHSKHMLAIIEQVGYTIDDLAVDNEAADYEMDLTFDYFFIPVHYTLSGDKLIASIPTDEIVSSGGSTLAAIDFLRFFGAGGPEEDGYLLVPAGSGALIHFNNNKFTEEAYTGTVYAQDYLQYWTFPQVTQTIRMPVFGIKRENAAVFAEIMNGSAIATISADVNGRTNQYNNVYANFVLRENEMLNVAGISGTDSDMTVVQEKPYNGDITLQYTFLAGDEANYAGMAKAYQQDLVERGVLKPLQATGATPFYLDILGAIEKQSFFLGVPYYAKTPMTSYAEAQDIVAQLTASGVSQIQMQWLGWFNGGVNHHLPRVIKSIGSIGNTKDRDALQNALAATGGDLYPAVKFVSTKYKSKNMNQMHEVSKSVAGYMGLYTGYSREFLRTMNTRFMTDVYQLVHPGMMPGIVDQFLTQYGKQNIDTLSLQDFGNTLSSSLYRINTVDRENSRLIMVEQMQKLDEALGDMMVVGGNDYSWAFTQNIVDVPTGADRYYITDTGIPFMQMVLHGYVDYAGTSVNTADVYEPDNYLLNMLATGAAPHYTWTYESSVNLERTPYDRFYATQYYDWLNQASDFYTRYNEVYKDLRTQRMTNYVEFQTGVSVTVFEDGTCVFVNKTGNTVTVEWAGKRLTMGAVSYYVSGVEVS